MNNISSSALYHLGLYFYEQMTFKHGSSAEKLYQHYDKHFTFRDSCTLVGALITVILLEKALFVPASLTLLFSVLIQSIYYWRIFGLSVLDAKCLENWRKLRKSIQHTKAFELLVREPKPLDFNLHESRYYPECLAHLRASIDPPSVKRQHVAASYIL